MGTYSGISWYRTAFSKISVKRLPAAGHHAQQHGCAGGLWVQQHEAWARPVLVLEHDDGRTACSQHWTGRKYQYHAPYLASSRTGPASLPRRPQAPGATEVQGADRKYFRSDTCWDEWQQITTTYCKDRPLVLRASSSTQVLLLPKLVTRGTATMLPRTVCGTYALLRSAAV